MRDGKTMWAIVVDLKFRTRYQRMCQLARGLKRHYLVMTAVNN